MPEQLKEIAKELAKKITNEELTLILLVEYESSSMWWIKFIPGPLYPFFAKLITNKTRRKYDKYLAFKEYKRLKNEALKQ